MNMESSFVLGKSVYIFPLNLAVRSFGKGSNPGLQQSVQLFLVFGFLKRNCAVVLSCLRNPNIFVKHRRYYGPEFSPEFHANGLWKL
jgi:hypothetical protein